VQNKLMEQVDWYQSQTGDAEQYPGEIIERDLASGKIDVAFAWGPIAGYFARNTRAAPIVAVPLASRPGMKLDFEIAMAVRHGDKEFRQRIDQLIDANETKIPPSSRNTACRCSTSRGGRLAAMSGGCHEAMMSARRFPRPCSPPCRAARAAAQPSRRPKRCCSRPTTWRG
jgi:hypothetical protein